MMFLSRKRRNKSNVNLSSAYPTTSTFGSLIPHFTRVYANDDVRYQPSTYLQALPLEAPLVNKIRIRKEYFFIPDRLYNVDLLADFSGVMGRPEGVSFPAIYLDTSIVSEGSARLIYMDLTSGSALRNSVRNMVGAGSLADYLGFPVGFMPGTGLSQDRISLTAVMGYLDTFYTYYMFQQGSSFPSARYEYDSDTPLSYTNEMLESLLRAVKTSSDPVDAIANWCAEYPSSFPDLPGDSYVPLTWSWLCSRASIFQRAFPNYYLESWLETSGYNAAEARVNVSSNSVSIRNIASQSHMQRYLDMMFAGGSRYSDFVQAEFDVSKLKKVSSPIFLGSDSVSLGANVLYQTTGAGDASSPLGSFAGQLSGGDSFKPRSFHFGESGYLMELTSIVPEVLYPDYLDPTLFDTSVNDVYAPDLDNIAMQPLLRHVVNPRVGLTAIGSPSAGVFRVSTDTDTDTSTGAALGYQPAWAHVMTQVSKPHGSLCGNLAYWSMLRTYGNSFESFLGENKDLSDLRQRLQSLIINPGTADDAETLNAFLANSYEGKSEVYSPYILPHIFNYIFADSGSNSQNFVLSCSSEVTVSREKSKVNVPTIL